MFSCNYFVAFLNFIRNGKLEKYDFFWQRIKYQSINIEIIETTVVCANWKMFRLFRETVSAKRINANVFYRVLFNSGLYNGLM